MPQQSQTVPEYWKVDGVLEKVCNSQLFGFVCPRIRANCNVQVFKLLGMESFFQSWRGGELDKWLENRFPSHLKEHVNVIFIGTAAVSLFSSYYSTNSSEFPLTTVINDRSLSNVLVKLSGR